MRTLNPRFRRRFSPGNKVAECSLSLSPSLDRITVFSWILRPFSKKGNAIIRMWNRGEGSSLAGLELVRRRNETCSSRRSLESRGVIETRHALSIDLSNESWISVPVSVCWREKVRLKVYLTMPGDNLHRCYPPRRIGKSLLNDQRLGKLYSFLHFSTRSSLRGTLLTVPLSAFSLQLAALAEIRKVIRVFTHASSHRSFLRPVYQVFTHEFLFFLSNANYYIYFIC